MGAKNTPKCEFGFDENSVLDTTMDGEPRADAVLEIILEKLKGDGKKIDVRSMEGTLIGNDNIFIYSGEGSVSLREDYGSPEKLCCKGHILNIFPYDLAAHFFSRDDEGRVINMHGETVCTRCEYFLRGRK